MALSKDGLLGLLEKLGVEHTTIEHAASPTCDDHSAALKGTLLEGFIGKGQAKNLFLKVPSGGGKLKNRPFLICALVDTTVNPKDLSARLGVKASAPLRLADEKLFSEVLQVPQGSVTPFVMGNESAKDVTLLLDVRFAACERLLFHPMQNDWTTAVTPAGLDAFLKGCGASARVVHVDFGASGEIALPDEPGAKDAAPAKADTKAPAKAPAAAAPESPKKHKEHKEQDFAPDHMFVYKETWEETQFAGAHDAWWQRILRQRN